VRSELQGPDPGGRTTADPAAAELPYAELDERRPGPDRPGSYWTGLVALAVGLAVTVAALAVRVTSIVQTVLLAVPLALVGLGLERVGRGAGRGSLRVLGAALLLVAVIGPVALSVSSPNPAVIAVRSAAVPAGASQATLRAAPGGGQLRIDPDATGLYQAELRGPGEPSADVATSGKVAVVDLRAPSRHGLLARNRGNDWAVRLSTGLPWRVEVDTSAVTADLDLQRLDVRGVRVEAGVSRLAVRLGEPAAEVPVDLRVSGALVDLYLPESSACEIRVDGLALNDFGQRGLVRQGGAWRTANADQPARYLVHIRITGGRIRLHRS
jgi:hypothetical protein